MAFGLVTLVLVFFVLQVFLPNSEMLKNARLYCFVRPANVGCPFGPQGMDPQDLFDAGSAESTIPSTAALPETRPWVSINHAEPWTSDELVQLAARLETKGWDIRGEEDGFDSVKTAEGVAPQVRFSDPDYAEGAAQLAVVLTTDLGLSEPAQVFDLSQSVWRSDDPRHLEIWLGKR